MTCFSNDPNTIIYDPAWQSGGLMDKLCREVGNVLPLQRVQWFNFRVMSFASFVVAVWAGRILLAMLEADMPTNEDVCVMSNKEVKAAKAFKLRKLTLNACTSKIAVTERFEVSQSSVLLGAFKGWQVSLQSDVALKQDIINPFWMMQVVDDKEQANMELVEKPDQKFDLNKFKVVLPLARNFKPVEPDDPLVLYRHPDTWKKAPPPVEVLRPSKRIRRG